MFDMYDVDGSGRLSVTEVKAMLGLVLFCQYGLAWQTIFDVLLDENSAYFVCEYTMLRSFMEIANDKMDKETDTKMDTMINKMFSTSDDVSDGLTFQDFQRLLEEFSDDIKQAQLNLNLEDKFGK